MKPMEREIAAAVREHHKSAPWCTAKFEMPGPVGGGPPRASDGSDESDDASADSAASVKSAEGQVCPHVVVAYRKLDALLDMMGHRPSSAHWILREGDLP